jgi:tripartite-type tricarboxylate transporter receptor subunit TctC
MALFLPAGSPEIIVTRLSQAVAETLADATVQKAYFEQGFEPKASSPAELGQYIATEIETYRQIVAEYGIKTQ